MKICEKLHPGVYIYLFMLVAVYFVYNFYYSDLNTGDDVYFASHTLGLDFLGERYRSWSSRTIIEIFQVAFAHHHACFRVVNAVALPIMIWAAAWLLGFNRLAAFPFCGLASLLYNFLLMNSTGIISTNVNYFWPLTLGLCGLAFYKKFCQCRKPHWYLFSVILIFASVSSEQACVAMLILFLARGGWLWRVEGKIPWPELGLILLLVLNVAYIVASPGNQHRYVSEIKNWFPAWPTLTLYDKLENGVALIGSYYFTMFNTIGIFFSCVLLTTLERQKLWRLFYFLPLATQFSFLALPLPIENNILFPLTVLNVVIYVLTLFAGNLGRRDKWLVLVVLATGFASRMLLTFSPTVFASSFRPFIFMDFSLVAAALLVMRGLRGNTVWQGFYLGLLMILTFANEVRFVRTFLA